MAEKVELKINDFELFCETVQNISKHTQAAKITFSPTGMSSSVKDKGGQVRLDVSSTCVCTASETVKMCSKEINVISQLLLKIVKYHTPRSKSKQTGPINYSDVHLYIDDQSFYLDSTAIQTRQFMVEECVIPTLKPFTDNQLAKVASVSVDTEDIKDILSSTFVFKNSNNLLADICYREDVSRNIAFAHLSDPDDPRSNDMFLKFGNITSGEISRKLLLDIPRLKAMALFPVDTLDIDFHQEPCAVAKFKLMGKNDSGCVTKYRLVFKYRVPNPNAVSNTTQPA